MLKQISSVVFREGTIYFHSGLNTILGDEKGSNSIGKSTLLMIIDFIYGGTSYIKENSDTVKHLGHHNFEFVLELGEKKYYFRRGTENSDIVEECNHMFINTKNLKISEYTSILHNLYISDLIHISFRAAVSTYLS
ncbi:AAA family ATPase [Fusibacter bizertensis]|uniref:AAA family ATPase n=1 Tax=Fusibacter bizertensis TaxID=1488331 RepID=A0ABT6NHL4_9FIRM|nr:AAA family ATPase [Fusibacter bizertensis]MDH8679927.1 AAA family ATPase [Fusibacter bizertensis]